MTNMYQAVDGAYLPDEAAVATIEERRAAAAAVRGVRGDGARPRPGTPLAATAARARPPDFPG